MNQHARQNAFPVGIAAIVMLVYGFVFGGFSAAPDLGPFYETTIRVFNWMLRIGGVALVVVALLSMAGWTAALLCDFLISGVCGSIMAACGVYWTVQERGFDIQNLLILVFGALFVRSALASWSLFATREAAAAVDSGGHESPTRGGWFSRNSTTAQAPREPAPPEPIHPASIHPSSLPGEGEAPPEEGYLAALSKEDEEPPTASFE
jgi:hypothetical protein